MPLNFKNAAALALASGLLAPLAAQAAPKPAVPTVRALPASHAMTSSTADVTLDFVAADINDVLKALSMQTHTNIVSGTDVKGPITVSLAHVSLEEALNLISKLSGYQYAKLGHNYVVGPPASIAALTPDLNVRTTVSIPFNFSDADDLMKSLEAVYPNVRMLLIKTAGTGTKTTDKKGSDGVTTKETEVKASTGGVINVTGTPDEIDDIRRLVTSTESTFPGSQVHTLDLDTSSSAIYNIKYASADDLQATLNRLVPAVMVTPGPVQRTYSPAPTTADAGGVTVATTSYGGSTAAAASQGGIVVADGGVTTSVSGNVPVKPTTTTLILTGSAVDIARARQVLATIDVRPLQINYEAKIIETSVNNDDQYGLGYDFGGAITQVGELGSTGMLGSGTFPGKILKFGTFARTPLTDAVQVKLNALFNDQNTKILASPNISAIDGQPAATFVGDTVSYISSVTQSATGQNITTSTVNAGIKLYVTGKVNNDGCITMNVHPEVSLVTLSAPGAGGVQTPDVRVREATTTVRVKDGETLVISGLINDQDVKSIQKVPLLGDIPFFGQLFRNTHLQHTHDQVTIFIKVSIQKDAV